MSGRRLGAIAIATLVGGGGVSSAPAHASGGQAQREQLPPVARWMPAEPDLVTCLNLASLTQSSRDRHWKERLVELFFPQLEPMLSISGLHLYQAIESICLFTVERVETNVSSWGAAMSGNGDPTALAKALQHHGPDSPVLYAPDPRTLLYGTEDGVRAMLAAGSGGRKGLTGGPLRAWLEKLPADATLWLAHPAGLALDSGLPPGNADDEISSLPVPLPRFFALSLRFRRSVEATAVGEASDPEEARTLVQAVQGLQALSRLQPDSNGASLLRTIRIQASGKDVEVSLALSYDILDEATRSK